MSEPLAESLSRFTPNAAGLDRDALLFIAGRASVRPSRIWPILTGMLAAAQLLTLVCLWPHTAPSAVPFIVSEPTRRDPAPMPAAEPDPSEWRVLRQRMQETDFDYSTPPSDEPMAPPAPPLHAFGTPPPYLLN